MIGINSEHANSRLVVKELVVDGELFTASGREGVKIEPLELNSKNVGAGVKEIYAKINEIIEAISK